MTESASKVQELRRAGKRCRELEHWLAEARAARDALILEVLDDAARRLSERQVASIAGVSHSRPGQIRDRR